MLLRYQEHVHCRGGHSRGITSVAFSPDGMYVATGGMDGKVCLWYVETGELSYQYKSTTTAVTSLVWIEHPESTIVCGLQNGAVALLRVTPRKLVVEGFWAHAYPVECLAVAGEKLATGAHSEVAVWKWDSVEKKYNREIDLKQPPKTSQNESQPIIVTSLHWTSSEQHPSLLFITYMNHGIQLLDARGWTSLRAVALQGRIASASLTPDGKLYAVSNLSNGFDVYSMESDAHICSFPHDVGEPYPAPVLFIHGGRALVCGTTVGQIDIWAVDLQRKMHSLSIRHQRHKKVLALAAQYVRTRDRFLIATGIFNDEGRSECIIWATHNLGPPDEHDDNPMGTDMQSAPARGNGRVEGSKLLLALPWLFALLCVFIGISALSSPTPSSIWDA